MVDRSKVACFSGHRKLPQDCTELKANLERAIVELIERGFIFFCNGGAVGFDSLAATTVLKLKEDYPHIRLIMVLPCPPKKQSLKWSEEQKRKYFEILNKADKVRILSPRYTSTFVFGLGCNVFRY